MKIWAQLNGGARATADAWQNRGYHLRAYVFTLRQDTDTETRQIVNEKAGPPPKEPPDIGLVQE